MTHYFAKQPGDGKQVSWHQDASYWPLITHHFPVQQAAAAWQLIESKAEDVLGVVLDW